MTKKELLLWLLEKLQYVIQDPFDNITNALIGLVNAVWSDEHLLTIIEQIIQDSLKKTLSNLHQDKLQQSLNIIQYIREKEQKENIDDKHLEEMLQNI